MKSTSEIAWVEEEVNRRRKQPWVTWLLFLVLGGLGAHRFHHNRPLSAIGIIITNILGWALQIILIGYVIHFFLLIWLILDIFAIPVWLREDKVRTRDHVLRDLEIRTHR